jgi:ABC-type multidrug transport system ATPase subunit
MIELDAVVARVPPVALQPLTARLDPGAHALLGGRADGPAIVLAAVAGRIPFHGGRARVLGFAPGDSQVRRRVAYVPLDVALPAPFRVREALAAAAEIRGEPPRDARARLEPFGIAALADRAVQTLSRDEARAVALAEALTSTATVLLVEEPLAAVDPRALAAVADALRARARAGACVVVATGSTRDARMLGDDILTFERGALARRAPATDPLVLAGPRGASVRVLASDPKRLATALAAEDAVRTVAIEAGVLVAEGSDVVSLAAAIARAALREQIALDMLRPDLLRDDELRSAIAGDTAGAYRAAYERALGPAPAARSGTHPEELA